MSLSIGTQQIGVVATRPTIPERTAATMRDVVAGHARRHSTLLFAGPAVIAAIAYVDPGNVATNIQAGARYGYEFLRVVAGANLAAMVFHRLSAKLGIVTGQNLAELCRPSLSKRLNTILVLFLNGLLLLQIVGIPIPDLPA